MMRHDPLRPGQQPPARPRLVNKAEARALHDRARPFCRRSYLYREDVLVGDAPSGIVSWRCAVCAWEGGDHTPYATGGWI